MDMTEDLITLALKEDIGPGDITTDTLIDPQRKATAIFLAKESMVVAGLDIARRVFCRLDPTAELIPLVSEGQSAAAGQTIARINGGLRALLSGERVALNFVQRLSGIASQTRRFLGELKSSEVRLVDTRKTTPGWRVLEKYAVRVGGGGNHRMGLYDGVLIKDNHIAACGGIAQAVGRARRAVSHFIKIEVEVADIHQVDEALAAGADIIMLDNMDLNQIRAAVSRINHRALVEVSGGVTAGDLHRLGDTGADLISMGALTHSARSVDISMDIEVSHNPGSESPAEP
jgi:nicotinate-nucleotide pyrophosphorylase (carboxylating)